MDRSRFLRLFGLALGGGALFARAKDLAGLPSSTPQSLPRFRPGGQGRVLVSEDGERTWRVHADFGPEREVLAVRDDPNGIAATLRFDGTRLFVLRLHPSGQHWVA